MPDCINWSVVPAVHIPIPPEPVCPCCGSGKRTNVRGEKNGDGSTTTKAICKSCSTPFLIIREPLPCDGSEIVWPGYVNPNDDE